MPDRIEAGTLLCMGAATSGKLELNNVISEHIIPLIDKLEECGCKFDINKMYGIKIGYLKDEYNIELYNDTEFFDEE